jgi:hypothetical protein
LASLTVALCLSATSARADILYQQLTDRSNYFPSQNFTDIPTFSIYEFDDLRTSGWAVNRITVYGHEQGNPDLNTGVHLAFTAAPDFRLVMAGNTIYNGVEDASGNLVFDNLNLHLTAGSSLWMTAWVDRNYLGGGDQWYWWINRQVTGSEEYFHNPGGGYGWGTEPLPGSSHFLFRADLAFTIEGSQDPLTAESAPEPGTLALLLLGLVPLLGYRWRRRPQADHI